MLNKDLPSFMAENKGNVNENNIAGLLETKTYFTFLCKLKDIIGTCNFILVYQKDEFS